MASNKFTRHEADPESKLGSNPGVVLGTLIPDPAVPQSQTRWRSVQGFDTPTKPSQRGRRRQCSEPGLSPTAPDGASTEGRSSLQQLWNEVLSNPLSASRPAESGFVELREVSLQRPKHLHAVIRRRLYGCRACGSRQLCNRAFWRQDGPRHARVCRQAETGIAQEGGVFRIIFQPDPTMATGKAKS